MRLLKCRRRSLPPSPCSDKSTMARSRVTSRPTSESAKRSRPALRPGGEMDARLRYALASPVVRIETTRETTVAAAPSVNAASTRKRLLTMTGTLREGSPDGTLSLAESSDDEPETSYTRGGVQWTPNPRRNTS
eukprot:scaffold74646_cov66-Phaeocystis_antarctica.AAC.7